MPRTPDEDLFESTKMTFGEHLGELRLSLFKAVVALAGGFLIGLLLGSWVVVWIQAPLKDALQKYYQGVSQRRRQAVVEQLVAQGKPVPEWLTASGRAQIPAGMTLEKVYIDPAAILGQLRQLYPNLLGGVKLPETIGGRAGERNKSARIGILIGRVPEEDERAQTKSLSVQEPFLVYVKAALVTGAIISSPFVFYFIWEFVAAGLYPHERRYVYIFMPFSLVLFIAGAALAFFVVLKFVLTFLFSFNAWLAIDPDPRISEWLGFALILPLGFGISFQLPLVMLFLERIGVFTVRSYLDKWRVAVLVIAVLSMLLTPADPSSMILMGIPLTALYFGGILLCRLMPRQQGAPGR